MRVTAEDNVRDSAVGELCKRALIRWPKHFANTPAIVVLGMEPAMVSMLIRKLGFLSSLLEGRDNVGSTIMDTLMDDSYRCCVLIYK